MFYKLVREGKLEQLKLAFIKVKGIEKSLANQKGADVKALTNEGKMVWDFPTNRDVQNALEEGK